MATKSDELIRKVTSELSDEILREQLNHDADVHYRAVPHTDHDDPNRPVWRVRFDLAFDAAVRMGLDISGEIEIGRGEDGPNYACLFNPHDAEQLGVSRHHALLRPTETHLYLLDLGSTNGTWLNGRPIGVNIPYSLSNGDYLKLGRMECTVRILKRPNSHTAALNSHADVADILPSIARAIITQTERSEILKQALDLTLSLASAAEASIWLVDEQTGELFLEAGQGVEGVPDMRLPVTDTLAGKVIETGQPLRANRQRNEEQIKLKTGYMVEAVIYVPLTLGGVTFGVLSAVHLHQGKLFTQREEQLVAAIAEFTAIAIQNARLYQATNHASNRRAKVVTALNYALSYDLKNLTKSIVGYSGLLQSSPGLDDETADIVQQLTWAGGNLSRLIDKLIEITMLSEDLVLNHAPCDLVEIMERAVQDMRKAAAAKSIHLDFQWMGDPYLIEGDALHLYRSVMHLIDNAVKYSPRGAQVYVSLLFWHNSIIIRIRDTGPGIPEADLPYLFDRYFRGAPNPDGQPSIGLGLEVVRATVEAHRGTVIARNAEDQGAEFIITLPITLRIQ